MRDFPRGYSHVRDMRRGGMTDLYVARNPEGERVVIRFIKKAAAKDRKVRKSFVEGEKILRQLEHRNIIRFIEAGKSNGRLYMIVEYHENMNLRERIANRDPLIHTHQLHLLRQLACALSYLHGEGFLHLDLKPENILIMDEAELILVDFDLAARHKNKDQKRKTVAGTLSYLAPETIREGILSQRAEIYVFGAVAYELLTGHKPYLFDNIENYPKLIASSRVSVTPARTYREDIPKPIEDLVLRCLQKDPAKRYPSMSLVHRDLVNM